MSLIMDATKKAQQLRSKELKGTPFSQEPGSKDEKRRPGRRKFWIFASAGSGIILLVLLLGNSFFPILTPHQTQTASIIEKKEFPTHPVIKKAFQEPSREDVPTDQRRTSLSSRERFIEKKGEEPLRKQLVEEKKPPIHSIIKEDSQEPSRKNVTKNQIRKSSSSMGPSIEKGKEEPLRKRLADEKKVVEVKPHKKMVTEKRLPRRGRPPGKSVKKAPPSPKEKVPSHSFGVKGENKKNSSLALDVITSFNLGVYFSNQGDMVKAIQAYQRVVELDPTYIEAYNNMGIIYQEIGDLDRAFGAYRKSVEINPRYEKGHNNLGILLYLKGSYEEARKAFQKALAINPDNIESLINLGILFKKQGQFGKAVGSYQKALVINPLHGETHYNIALLYEQLENVEFAIGHYQKFIRLSSKTRPGLVSKVKRHLNYLMETGKDKKR